MNKKDIDMLRPRRLHGWQDIDPQTTSAEKKKGRSFLFYLIPGIIIILIFSIFFLVRSFTLASWSNNPGDYDKVTLQPKKNGILSILKN